MMNEISGEVTVHDNALGSIQAQLSVAVADRIGVPLRAVEAAVAAVTADWSVRVHVERNRVWFAIQAPCPLKGQGGGEGG
jgi:hypothetical protein